MTKRIRNITALAFVLVMLAAPASRAAEPAGLVASVYGDASAVRADGKGTEPLGFKSPVYYGDYIFTGANSSVQVIVGYSTMLSLGPGAKASIRKAAMRPGSAKERKDGAGGDGGIGINIVLYGGASRITVNTALLPRDQSGNIMEAVFVQTPQGWFEMDGGENNDMVISLPPVGKGAGH